VTRLDAFSALCVARFREFFRESEAIFWSFVFPIVLSVALGLAFRERPAEVLPVGVVTGKGAAAVAGPLRALPRFKVLELDEAAAAQALRMGKVALLVTRGADGLEYRLDPGRPESALARLAVDDALQRAAGRADPLPARQAEVREPGSRYIDFLIPGLIGLNILNGGLWGVGFNLVDMRIKKLLKRLLATPMRRSDFLAAQLLHRSALMFVEVTFLLAFGRLALGVPVRGSWAAIFAVGAVGALSASALGLLLGSRANRIETVMGLMNAVSLPMMIGSGVFFSVERFPEWLHPLLRALPLTALIDALRAVVLEGATLASQGGPLVVVAAWGVLCFAAGLRLFRWN
jgi:ABC-2 type transport system permease protein